jgi:hypothetical protein
MRSVSLFLVLLLSSCGSLLDISGKGAKTKCLYFDCSSMKVVYSCDDRQLWRVVLYENKTHKAYSGKLLLEKKLEPFASEWTLPFDRDSLAGKYLQLDLQITDSHPRESYSILINPGDLSSGKKIPAYYFSH